MWSAIFRRNQVNDAVIPNNKINVLERMKKVRNSCFNLRINNGLAASKNVGTMAHCTWQSHARCLKEQVRHFQSGKIRTFWAAMRAQQTDEGREEPTKTFCENTDFQHCDFQHFHPKEIQRSVALGACYCSGCAKEARFISRLRMETARNGVFDSLCLASK